MPRKVVHRLLSVGLWGLLGSLLLAPAQAQEAAAPTPQWLWTSKSPVPNENVQFRRTINVKPNLKSASLSISCDNSVWVFINNNQVVQHTEWNKPLRENIAQHLKEGENVFVFRGRNEDGAAGILAQITLHYEDGTREDIVTDDQWEVLPADSKEWRAPVVLGALGMAPWGKLPFGDQLTIDASTPVDDITLLPGFTIDLIHSVPKGSQGSWVSLTTDPKGRLIACDQYGGLYRITPGAPGKEAETKIEQIPVEIGDAQGLLFVEDVLFVMVNGQAAEGSGLYRVTDTNNDDMLDKVELIKKLDGTGEHGPHAIRLGPDGRLWVIAGNHTHVPEFDGESPHKNYAEDLLLPRNPDGNGHATGRMAPGGWIASLNLDGTDWRLFCAGFRNPYDFDFNSDGEIFAYDADMEWDTGVPWYRPTRVNHAVSAAEFGWRYGTGKWPAYYVDSVGAVVDIGMGSPTGVEFGYNTKFPAKYQQALYILDWTYGKIYAVHNKPQGASYTASFETFIEGRPFPVTDATVNPHDGALYVTIGGRKMQSGLYRVRYTGDESTEPAAPAADPAAAEARALRRRLEVFHTKQDPRSLDFAWGQLGSADRAIRYAARVAIENQPINSWKDRALAEAQPASLIQAMVALARAGSLLPEGEHKPLQTEVLKRLQSLPLERMTVEQVLDACRAYQLAFIRLGGQPEAKLKQEIIAKLDALVPAQSEFINQELTKLLVYLEAPSIIQKSLARMASVPSQQDQMFYAFTLRTLKPHWTVEQRKTFFTWIQNAEAHGRGGNSFVKFLQQMREDATATMTPELVQQLGDVMTPKTPVESPGLVVTRQFVHNWQLADFQNDLQAVEQGRDFKSGKRAYEATQCAKCHRFAGTGGDTGPDITGVGARFNTQYLLESLIEPSKAISDQYKNSTLVTVDGEVITGRIINETPMELHIRTDPFARELTPIAKKDVEEQVLNETSEMPQGLINVLSKEEVLDLIAYLRSAGQESDPAFSQGAGK